MLNAHADVCRENNAMIIPRNPTPRAIENSFRCLDGGTVTPILYGHPWLEKPALYYWRAMGFFKEFGVSDWSARLPSATGAFLLIIMIFLHMRRFRPGGQLDAALITASSVAIIGFARGASTDMQLAAPFCIGMLGWYAWYETGKKFWLVDLYFFGAAATLAKGPVAPFLALCIILLFLGLRREWSALRRTIWIPGVLLYLVMVLPWYIAVQRENPTFIRSFIVEHNLERFATNLYEHRQPCWYYLVVLLVGLMPWTIVAIRAVVAALGDSVAEWKVRINPKRYLGHSRPGDAFPEFLVLWALFPIVFFTFSKSKLPGYILPSIPPLTILTGDYLNRIRRNGLPEWLLYSHAAACALVIFVITLAPQHMVYETLVPSAGWLICAGASPRCWSSSPSSKPSASAASTTSATPHSSPSSPPWSSCSASTARTSTSTTPHARSPARCSNSPPNSTPSPSKMFAATWSTALPSISTSSPSITASPPPTPASTSGPATTASTFPQMPISWSSPPTKHPSSTPGSPTASTSPSSSTNPRDSQSTRSILVNCTRFHACHKTPPRLEGPCSTGP